MTLPLRTIVAPIPLSILIRTVIISLIIILIIVTLPLPIIILISSHLIRSTLDSVLIHLSSLLLPSIVSNGGLLGCLDLSLVYLLKHLILIRQVVITLMVVIHLASSSLSNDAGYSIARMYRRQERTLRPIIPQAIPSIGLISQHPHLTIIQVHTVCDMICILYFLFLLVRLS